MLPCRLCVGERVFAASCSHSPLACTACPSCSCYCARAPTSQWGVLPWQVYIRDALARQQRDCAQLLSSLYPSLPLLGFLSSRRRTGALAVCAAVHARISASQLCARTQLTSSLAPCFAGHYAGHLLTLTARCKAAPHVCFCYVPCASCARVTQQPDSLSLTLRFHLRRLLLADVPILIPEPGLFVWHHLLCASLPYCIHYDPVGWIIGLWGVIVHLGSCQAF